MHNAPMKRTVLLGLLLTPFALAGCQTIKAHNPFAHTGPDYQSARQEHPLEVPPGMDQPATSEALVIPNAGTPAVSAAAPGAPPAMQSVAQAPPASAPPAAAVAPAPVATTGSGTSMALTDTPASAYHRVGLALERGGIGQVVARDDATMSFQVAVDTVVTEKDEGGFFHRLFHREKSEVVKGTVTVSVAPQGAGSVVTAAGDPAASARVMAMLQQRLQ